MSVRRIPCRYMTNGVRLLSETGRPDRTLQNFRQGSIGTHNKLGPYRDSSSARPSVGCTR